MALAAMVEIERETRVLLAPGIDVPAEGRAIRVQWAPVAGASDAQVDSASIQIGPAVLERNLGPLPVAQAGDDRLITVPPNTRIRALTLDGLKTDNGTVAPSETELSAQARRLAVTLETGGPSPAPQYAVRPCDARRMIPASLTGATYANRVLWLPDVAASKIRLSLVEGGFPEEFTKRSMTLAGVTGLGALLPRDLALTEPDGATVVWAFPNEMPLGTPDLAVDLSASLTKLIAAALKADQPLDFTYRLKGDDAARVTFRFSGAKGALRRPFAGVLEHTLEGDPVALALPGSPLAGESPSKATGDLTVEYQGMRILESVSDPVPTAAGDVAGLVVGDTRRVRAFPPNAFDSLAPARVGVFGRAPVECELSIQLVEMNGDDPGPAIAPPGVVRLSPSTTMSTVWITLPAMAPPARPLGCVVRASEGRFLWAAGDQPLVRVAVYDPDPGGRPLLLNDQSLVVIEREPAGVRPGPIHLPAHSFPAAAFRATRPWLASNLFLKVDVSDLVLSYAR